MVKTLWVWSLDLPWRNGVDAKGAPENKISIHLRRTVGDRTCQCIEGIFSLAFLEPGARAYHIGWYVDDLDEAVKILLHRAPGFLSMIREKFAYLDAGGVGGAVFELLAKK